jgi:hypothetical protein
MQNAIDFAFYFGIMAVIMGFLSWAWVNGIDRAMRDFPDYRGEDLLDEFPAREKRTESLKTHGQAGEKPGADKP